MEEEYKRLMSFRTKFILGSLLGMPLFLCGIYYGLDLFGCSSQVIILMIILLALSYVLVGSLIFLAKMICPWCKQGFFSQGVYVDGLSLIVRKNCIHCGMPNKKQHESSN